MKMFQNIAIRKPGRNKFDLSHERKLTLNMGDLVPILCQEILPGDSFRVKSEVLMRFAPMLAPVMHRVNVFTHYFFVPNRLLWDEWEDFITGGREGTSAPLPPVMPIITGTVSAGQVAAGTLADYLGFPPISAATAVVDEINISALPFRAYQLIYDEYYRDQNLQASLDISKASSAVSAPEFNKLATLRKRAWEKDYFTSALPWAQRGAEVLLPIEGTGTVEYDPTGARMFTSAGGDSATGAVTGDGVVGGTYLEDSASQRVVLQNILNDEVTIDNGSTTVTDLRRSIKLQEWLEKAARGGARYAEQMLSFFGVRSDDARLQRPEYLGGGKTPVVISEVLSSYQDPTGTGEPQGSMAGHGISVGTSNGFKRSFKEHGFVVGIMSVLPTTAYQQGIPRMFRREDKFDYFWNEFARIGEQEVKMSELYYDPELVVGTKDETFGYQSRYSEYKYQPSTVHGDFRDSLAFWQMGRVFSSKPSLNETFVKSDPTLRIFAVDDPAVHHLYCQLYNRVDALRPMPYFGTPSL